MRFTYEVKQDQDTDSPRDWNNLGTMVCWHRRMNLGDVQYTNDFLIPEKAIMLNIRAYEHGSISLTADPLALHSYPFSDPWDSGFVGFIYVTYEDIFSEYGRKRMSEKLAKQVEDILKQEVETYNQYLNGDVWYYIIEDEDGDVVDSCGGFYGHDYCVANAESMAKWQETTTPAKDNHLIGSISP